MPILMGFPPLWVRLADEFFPDVTGAGGWSGGRRKNPVGCAFVAEAIVVLASAIEYG